MSRGFIKFALQSSCGVDLDQRSMRGIILSTLRTPRLITLGQFGRCFGGIEAKVDDQVPLACFRRRWWSKLGYVMGIVRERA